MRRLLLPAVAVAVLLGWGWGSRLLPAIPVRADIMVSAAIVLTAVAALVWAMLPLSALGRRLPLVALAALPCAVLLVWVGWVPAANVAKVVFAAALGIWIADELERAQLDRHRRGGLGGRGHRQRGRRAHQGHPRAKAPWWSATSRSR